MISAMSAGAGPGSEANMLKIRGSELQQDIAEAMIDAAGSEAFEFDGHAVPDARPGMVGDGYARPLSPTYFNLRKVSIYGGSNEIQRNILAKTLLGL
jgi:alkylation response protein AidB-like acyl-CoA dehydrogenase